MAFRGCYLIYRNIYQISIDLKSGFRRRLPAPLHHNFHGAAAKDSSSRFSSSRFCSSSSSNRFFVRNFLLVQFQRNGIFGRGRRRRSCRRRRRYRRRLRTLIRSWRKSSIVEKRLVAHSVADATDRLFGTLELSMSGTKTLIA